jgi:3-oxoacyl-[acyl-carrier protein] reductase
MAGYHGKTVLITGGGSGLGQACALAFAQAGARVIAADIHRDAAAHTVALIAERQGDGPCAAAAALLLDVASAQSVRQVLDEALAREPVHVLVNSAGIGAVRPFLETDSDLLDRMHAVNVRGTFLCCQAAARAMIARGIAGAIVNIGSASGARGNAGRAAYGASKAAVANLTQVMAVELAASGIRVNAVAPGPVETPMVLATHSAGARRAWLDKLPLGRYAGPEEIAQAVLYLAGEQASYVTGHIMYVDGGFQGAGVMKAD